MAYAAVISLERNIQHLTSRTNCQQIRKPVCKELKSLRNILKGLDRIKNRSNRSAINALDEEIRDAVWKLEDVLESYAYRLPSNDIRDAVEQATDCFLKTVNKLGEEYTRALNRRLPREEEEEDALVPVNDFGGKKPTTVGSSDQLEKIMNELVDPQSESKTVSLVGMAGIGKTHLARQIYHHPTILEHFDLKAWVGGGPEQEVKDAWVDAVAGVERRPRDVYLETNIITLVEILRKSLRGRRCLIVLDDVWSTEVYYSLICLLRADGNGSRLLLTTRLEKVAKHFKSRIHQMRFLNNEESWNLLEQNVFVEKSCPRQLEKYGRKIAEKCEGLPLLILAVANILCGLDKTEEYWNKVAEEKTTTFTDAYDMISKVLFSSYEYLPQYLKPCFLYMGVFPQRCEILASKLIKLLRVEDFLGPEPSLTPVLSTPQKPRVVNQKQRSSIFDSLEFDSTSTCSTLSKRELETLYLLEPGPSLTGVIRPLRKIDSLKPKPEQIRRLSNPFATSKDFFVEYVEEVVSHSLAIVCKQSSKFRIKSCKLHSAYWHLCVKEARKTKFFHVLKKLTDGSQEYMESQRRLSVQNNILFGIKDVYESVATASTARSLLCTGEGHEYPVPICLSLMFLKVLDALSIRLYEFPTEVVKLIHLRYLALTHNGELPSSISNLQQLQCLIVRQHHNIKFMGHSTYLPKEIWDLHELTHLQIMGSNLRHARRHARRLASLPSLVTLYVNADSCTAAVFNSTPFLKKLGITIELQPGAAETISCFEHIMALHELESLKCVIVNPRLIVNRVIAPPDHLSNFPRSLKKLSLNGLGYSWKYMIVIGSLPNLQVLKLRYSAFQGAEWKTGVGEFQSLSFLLLEDIDVVHWITDDEECFPRLRRLIIRNCYKLKEIPQSIQTLESLEIENCSPTIVAYAEQIREDSNSCVEVMIESSWKL